MNLEERLKLRLLPVRWHLASMRRRLRKLEPELVLLHALVPRGRAALDVGANKGVYSLELIKLASNVHAFEPNTDLMPWLFRLRHPRLTIHPYALGDCDREAVLRVPIGRGGKPSRQGATLARTVRVSQNYLKMQTVVRRLDSITLGDVGFIKIDVERFEMQVIEGTSETIARSRPVMLVEIEPVHTGDRPWQRSNG